jgi:hypothetical protein
MPAKKLNRGHLLRAAKKGHLYVKCSFHYTDDYAFDYANNNGKGTHFRQVRIKTYSPEARKLRDEIDRYYAEHKGQPSAVSHAAVEPMMQEVTRLDREHRDAERAKYPGVVWMTESDFRTKSGRLFSDGSFSVHSNLVYQYKIVKDEPVTVAAV